MTRRYAPGTGSSGGPRLTPSPTPQGPRVGVQVVRARKPRVGPSAAEEMDGAVPPIDLADGLGAILDYSRANDSRLSNGVAGQHVVKSTACLFCSATGESDILIQGYPAGPEMLMGGDAMVCGTCIERLIDALRAELPRRRLRLAMERLAAGTVSIETVEAVERLAAGATHE